MMVAGCFGYAVVVIIRGDSKTRPAQHEDQSTKLPFMLLPREWKTLSPRTLKAEQGANLKRQQTGRGPCRCGLGSACYEPHSDIHTSKSIPASAPQSPEQGGNESLDLIPRWTDGSYGLGGQQDLFWILGLLRLVLVMLTDTTVCV